MTTHIVPQLGAGQQIDFMPLTDSIQTMTKQSGMVSHQMHFLLQPSSGQKEDEEIWYDAF